jgi:hypothetical protein
MGRLLVLGLLLTLAASSTQAQESPDYSVRGRIVHSADEQSIQGVLVTVRGPDGDWRGSTLSGASGRYAFRNLAPGRYQVFADMIGYAVQSSEPFELGADQGQVVNLRLDVAAIPIEGFAVRREKRCGLAPEEGIALSTVWEETREALTRTSLSASSFTYEIEKTFRIIDSGGELEGEETRTPQIIRASTPFVSLPAETFNELGYIIPDTTEDVLGFYGPDADALLSGSFLETHCFELKDGEDEKEGMIGLAFEPYERGDIPDVAGVLWLDAETLGLEHMEFQYRNFMRGREHRRLGGDIHFMPLPNGAWIIRAWEIRTPRLTIGPKLWNEGYRPTARMVRSISVDGAVVRRVRDQRGEPVLDADSGLIRGVVLDAKGERSLEGVIVTLAGTGRMARTNAEGAFRFLDVPEGDYTLDFSIGEERVARTDRFVALGVQTFVTMQLASKRDP